jgi:Protein of unknown function (DUF1553)/Protein of unknown function (DUF1549)/Planctomycete cytochrome C/F5/8 type C domain
VVNRVPRIETEAAPFGNPGPWLVALLVALTATTAHAEDAGLFAKEVAPLLEGRCLSCHGEKVRKAGLSLATAADALAGSSNGPVIVPGKPAESRIVAMVSGDKPKMPRNGTPLSAEQVAGLKRWIEEGAKWPDGVKLRDRPDGSETWWSLRALARPTVPAVKNAAWVRTSVDQFVLATLEREGLSPNPEADRRTLIRRLTFDLHGLPPTPEETDAFVSDPDPRAYEKLVDRLLASPHYGERWARHWLDVVHYGDTHGYDKDKLRPNAWPYRDYVIRAFNDDVPYARFVKEQLAGDVFYPGTRDGVVALGFLAAGPWDFVGQVELREGTLDKKITRTLDRDDFVATAMNTFISLTVQCARCHDHKFDPITQEDYYSLQAVFAAVDRADRPYDADPETARRREELTRKQADLSSRRTALDARVRELGGAELTALEKRIELSKAPGAGEKPEFGYHSQIERGQDVVKWVQVDLGKATAIDTIVYVGCHDTFNNVGAGFGFPVRYKVELSDDAEFAKAVTVEDRTGADVPNPGVKPQSVNVGGKKARYVRFTATKLAPRQNDYIFALAELSVLTGDGSNAASGATRRELAELEKEQKATAAALAALPPPGMVYAAATEFTASGSFTPTGGKPRPVFVLHRGSEKNPKQEVGPGAVGCVAGLESRFKLPDGTGEGERRAALAKWVVDERNPLPWRSIVNRVWLYHFGKGLVDTPNDFGRMGGRPTHPELLDWLAVEFRDNGQSLKGLHRLLVTSAAYRQSSAHAEVGAKADAGNRWLWRMNRRKLEAEEVRDSVLWVSGQLGARMYGPGFRPFGFVDDHSPRYKYEEHDPDDPDSHRRSLYRFLVRSVPDPFMETLDCADPSLIVEKRNETVTALQALALLNDKFMVRMAEHFAARVERAGDLAAQVTAAYRLALGRPPEADELAVLTEFARKRGLANVCRLLLNTNEFNFVD